MGCMGSKHSTPVEGPFDVQVVEAKEPTSSFDQDNKSVASSIEGEREQGGQAEAAQQRAALPCAAGEHVAEQMAADAITIQKLRAFQNNSLARSKSLMALEQPGSDLVFQSEFLATNGQVQGKSGEEVIAFRRLGVSEDKDENDRKPVELSELTWELDVFSTDCNWRVDACMAMFQANGLSKSFKIADSALMRFILTVRANYHENPFHNFAHAFSVLHAAWLMCGDPEIGACLEERDILAILIAAICHDVDHPGVNNDFLNKAKDPLSARYPAPFLENHHSAVTQEILTDAGAQTDLLRNLEAEERDYIMEMILGGIAATDMGVHTKLCDKLHQKAERKAQGEPISSLFKKDSLDDRRELVQVVVHAADLSAQALDSKETAYQFGQRCLREFHYQCRKEGDLGVEESGFMKNLDKPLQQAKAQLGFISFVLVPLWADFAAVFSGMEMRRKNVEERMKEIDFDNIDEWGGLVPDLTPHPERPPKESPAPPTSKEI
eukprot:CAMPEP_0206255310 /NCGR_PEP_ID=MMETSP0047_2-20121206/24177_1 /ASSEMBLY_ACC=CAM_ASM_000192 /TAXON_ID=195065 /ORGANISM="Chroomonas mesostigmatica_cf, Strain CCMP1168" /LENGTH=493 /DNA_ID=CAMNT_0053681697 /DNA_START=70 /DNA_END=1552 /DNA_ORIENTATION=-